jgi:broad specificity phosphatase PhoE
VRHGEVEGNSGERRTFAGWNDLALTPRGEQQARATAKRLERENVRAVYASDLQRARRTAETIAQPHGLPVQTDAALREVHYGTWAGLGEADVVRLERVVATAPERSG